MKYYYLVEITCVVSKDMNEGAVTSVRTVVGDTKEFPIAVGLHQESTLNPTCP